MKRILFCPLFSFTTYPLVAPSQPDQVAYLKTYIAEIHRAIMLHKVVAYNINYSLPSLEDYELPKPWTVFKGAVSDFSANASPFTINSFDQSFGASKPVKAKGSANNALLQ